MRRPERGTVRLEVTEVGNRAASRPNMSREERAKQCMPFAALKGYEEALKEKEKIVVPRRELSEETKEQLDRRLPGIRRGDMITVIYYCQGEYLKLTGMVSRIDTDARVLKIVNTKITFEDLFQIQGEQFEE